MKKAVLWLYAHGPLARAVAAGLITLGVLLGCPAVGITATLPLSFCLFVPAALLCGPFLLPAAVSLILSLALGFGMRMASPFVFAGEMCLVALAASGLAVCLKKAVGEKKKKWFAAAAVLALAGIVLPAVLYGAPWQYLSAGRRAKNYFAERYPDQSFTRICGYRDPLAGAWRFECDYVYDGNTLTSAVLFGKDGVEDGFLKDRVAFEQEPRRSALIEAFHDGEENVLVEPDGFSEALARQAVIPGVYGVCEPSLEGEMCFTVTFLRAMDQKREVKLAVAGALKLLREKGLRFYAIRFVAENVGEPLFTVTVTPDTPEEQVMDLITRV